MGVKMEGKKGPFSRFADGPILLLLVDMGLGRVELPTSRLSGVRSNHLSYRPC
jgi:hypothetical protein